MVAEMVGALRVAAEVAAEAQLAEDLAAAVALSKQEAEWGEILSYTQKLFHRFPSEANGGVEK